MNDAASSIELVVPEAEQEDVGPPEHDAGKDQLAAIVDVPVEEVVREESEGVDVDRADESDQGDSDLTPQRRVPDLWMGRGHREAEQKQALNARQEPGRSNGQLWWEHEVEQILPVSVKTGLGIGELWRRILLASQNP